MTPDEIRRRFEDPASFRWVPLSALRAGEFLSCIDGRHDEYVIAGPGGDLGEVVVLLTVIEQLAGTLSHDRIQACVGALMDWHPRFYMHTDRAALDALEATLAADPRFASGLAVSNVEKLVRMPPHEVRDTLAATLMRPEHMGCGHLKSMAGNPASYGVRPFLVQHVMRTFFERLWNGSHSTQFVVLEGLHDERAVLSIEVDGEPNDGLFVPAVLQSAEMPSVFVQHVPAREYLRRSYLDVLEHHGFIHDLPDDRVMGLCAKLAGKQLKETVAVLAPDLPHFTVHFGESRAPVCKPG